MGTPLHRSSPSSPPSSSSPCSPLPGMVPCFTAYLEVTEMTILVRRGEGNSQQADSGSSSGSGSDSGDGNLDVGVSDGVSFAGEDAGGSQRGAGQQAIGDQEGYRGEKGGGTGERSGGGAGGGGGSGCGWSCVRHSDVPRPTLAAVTAQGALGLDAFVGRKGRSVCLKAWGARGKYSSGSDVVECIQNGACFS